MAILKKQSADQLREMAKERSDHTSKSVMMLGEVLWRTYYDKVQIGGMPVSLFEAWGFGSWFEYVERELGIHQTTALHFRKIYTVFAIDLKGAWDPNLIVSFTKMKLLARVATKANVNSWLKKASKMSCCELEDEVMHELYGHARKGHMHSFLASVTKTELKKIKEILAIAHEDFDQIDRRGELLVKVLEEWQIIHKRTRKVRAAKVA